MTRFVFLLLLFQLSTISSSIADEGILISGGASSSSSASVEVFFPLTSQSCSFPSLPDGGRHHHTMESFLVCGGGDFDYSFSTCVTFDSGEWATSHTLVEWRFGHSSWQTDQGVILMGGWDSRDTSEIVPMTAEQGELAFALEHSTRYACSMSDLTSDTVIITGGHDNLQTVSRYGTQGFLEDLPPLLVGRLGHGCGAYLREADRTQVLLVAGGYDSNGNSFLSTEVLSSTSTQWIESTPLPRNMWSLKGVTVGGKLYMTGGKMEDDEGNFVDRDDIITWLDEEQEWVEAGKMMKRRSDHAVTKILMDNTEMKYCR